MLIELPRRMVGGFIDRFLDQMFTPTGQLRYPSFEIDFSNLAFIEPPGVVSLANAIEFAQHHECPVTLRIPGMSSAAVSYLDDSGIFKLYAGKSLNQMASLRGTTAPFQRVSHSESHHWLEKKFSYWLANRMGVETESLGSMQACMREIFNNIENHSGLKIGCTHMQHFPTSNEVVIAISDFGVGIPSTIRSKFPDYTDDAQAILHASQDGVTAGTTPRNRGIGLNLLIDLVVGTNRGRVHIYSGHGRLACRTGSVGELRKPWTAPSFYPGTMVEIRLNTTTFRPDDVEREALQW